MWRKKLTALYQDSGAWEVYTFPPVIILDTDAFDSHVDIKDGCFTLSEKPSKLGDFWVFRTEGYPYGLFISKGSKEPELRLNEKTIVKASSLYLIEYDSNS